MIGSARAEEANAEYQKACPSGRPFNNTILWREARSTPEKVDFSSWQMRSNDADGKAGSGISVYSKFRTRYVSQGQVVVSPVKPTFLKCCFLPVLDSL